MQGPLREDLTSISTISSAAGSPQEPVNARIYHENALSASRDAVEMHMDVSQKQFYARIYRKNATCRERDKFVRACAIEIICRNAHGHITKAIACGNLQEKIRKNAGAQDHENPAAQTLCDPQQSKCTWISHEATFMREFTAKKAGTRERTLT